MRRTEIPRPIEVVMVKIELLPLSISSPQRAQRTVLVDLPSASPDSPDTLLTHTLLIVWAGLGGCLMTAEERREQLDEDIQSGNDEAGADLGVMLHEMDLRIMRREGGKWEAMVRDAHESS